MDQSIYIQSYNNFHSGVTYKPITPNQDCESLRHVSGCNTTTKPDFGAERYGTRFFKPGRASGRTGFNQTLEQGDSGMAFTTYKVQRLKAF